MPLYGCDGTAIDSDGVTQIACFSFLPRGLFGQLKQVPSGSHFATSD